MVIKRFKLSPNHFDIPHLNSLGIIGMSKRPSELSFYLKFSLNVKSHFLETYFCMQLIRNIILDNITLKFNFSKLDKIS